MIEGSCLCGGVKFEIDDTGHQQLSLQLLPKGDWRGIWNFRPNSWRPLPMAGGEGACVDVRVVAGQSSSILQSLWVACAAIRELGRTRGCSRGLLGWRPRCAANTQHLHGQQGAMAYDRRIDYVTPGNLT